MAYSKFKTINELKQSFGLEFITQKIFATNVTPINPSNWLAETLEMADYFQPSNEKAISERVISPILLETARRNKNIALLSGENLQVDAKLGLTGECDFIFSKSRQNIQVEAPILQIIEAKKGDIEAAIPQCVAQMYASVLFNKKYNAALPALYGATTNRAEWHFLKLENNIITIDERPYNISDLPQILGVLQVIIDFYKD